MDHKAFIGIGSNIGNCQENCLASIKHISNDNRAGYITSSSLYLTSPVSDIKQDDFINCAVSFEWKGGPLELLNLLQKIEATMGRKRAIKNGPRIIDLDILMFSDITMDNPRLIIPHTELHKRKFAIIPCLEIEPELIHPGFKKPLKDFLYGMGEEQVCKKLPLDILMPCALY